MRWLQTEYVLKGIYLGLLLFVALHEPDWQALVLVAALSLVGLGVALAVVAYRKSRTGYQIQGRLPAFLLFLMLEGPEIVYAGVLLGMFAAALLLRKEEGDSLLLSATVAGGAVLGIVFWLLRYVRRRLLRLGLGLLLGIVLVGGILFWFGKLGDFGLAFSRKEPINATIFGAQLLLGIPLFYLLTFAGREEESEVEIAAICAALGIGLTMLTRQGSGLQSVGLLVPVMLYLWYTTQVLPRLRVFKHAIRGFSYSQIGQHRQAILSFRRALEFEPHNRLAREGLWRVHRTVDLSHLADDPQMMAIVDAGMCLERASSLLLEPGPGAQKLEEAQRLLDLVLRQQPSARARVHYWRAVAYTHARRYDEAASELEQVVDPTGYLPNDADRRAILLPAWQLALRLHPELVRRVGTPQLALPGRRMDAIAAVERHLADHADDADVWGYKRSLYQSLTERDYDAAPASRVAAGDFDHNYAQQLGLALINDPARWQNGVEYLRIAAKGLPAQAPSIYSQIAQAHQRNADGEGAWHYYELAKQAGRALGPKALCDEDRHAYFAALKLLGDGALAHGQVDLALENYQLYSEYERSGVETLRTLADLYERRGDPLGALRVTEKALLYNAKDKDFLERKDRYYYSVMPDHLQARLETIQAAFDVDYCLRKARTLLDTKNWDVDLLDWAQHLAELTLVVRPGSLAARVLVARARLRRGEKEEAMALLQEIHSPKPESFKTGEDEDAWYLATKLLGEMYLYDLNKPDLAVECLKEYRQSSKSGADTMYKLGQAYEQLGDRPRAVKFYKHVVAYDGHPLAPEAHDALSRLQAH
jgi:hypothetical protein